MDEAKLKAEADAKAKAEQAAADAMAEAEAEAQAATKRKAEDERLAAEAAAAAQAEADKVAAIAKAEADKVAAAAKVEADKVAAAAKVEADTAAAAQKVEDDKEAAAQKVKDDAAAARIVAKVKAAEEKVAAKKKATADEAAAKKKLIDDKLAAEKKEEEDQLAAEKAAAEAEEAGREAKEQEEKERIVALLQAKKDKDEAAKVERKRKSAEQKARREAAKAAKAAEKGNAFGNVAKPGGSSSAFGNASKPKAKHHGGGAIAARAAAIDHDGEAGLTEELPDPAVLAAKEKGEADKAAKQKEQADAAAAKQAQEEADAAATAKEAEEKAASEAAAAAAAAEQTAKDDAAAAAKVAEDAKAAPAAQAATAAADAETKAADAAKQQQQEQDAAAAASATAAQEQAAKQKEADAAAAATKAAATEAAATAAAVKDAAAAKQAAADSKAAEKSAADPNARADAEKAAAAAKPAAPTPPQRPPSDDEDDAWSDEEDSAKPEAAPVAKPAAPAAVVAAPVPAIEAPPGWEDSLRVDTQQREAELAAPKPKPAPMVAAPAAVAAADAPAAPAKKQTQREAPILQSAPAADAPTDDAAARQELADRKAELRQDAQFKDELRRARKKFYSMDEDGNGTLDSGELMGLADWIWTDFAPNGESISESQKTQIVQHLHSQVSESETQVMEIDEFFDWYTETFASILMFRDERVCKIAAVGQAAEAAVGSVPAQHQVISAGDAAQQVNTDEDVKLQIKQTRKHFYELDVDGNGVLDKHEMPALAEWVWQRFNPGGQAITDQQRQESLATLVQSANSDGEMEFQEFAAWMKKNCADVVIEKSKKVQELAQAASDQNAKAQAAKDAASSYSTPRMRMVSWLDTGDSLPNFVPDDAVSEQAVADSSNDPEVVEELKKARKHFQQMDKDGNGVLDMAELLDLADWVWESFHPNGEFVSEAERTTMAGRLLARLDKSGKNAMAFESFAAWFIETCAQIKVFRQKQAKSGKLVATTARGSSPDSTGEVSAREAEAAIQQDPEVRAQIKAARTKFYSLDEEASGFLQQTSMLQLADWTLVSYMHKDVAVSETDKPPLVSKLLGEMESAEGDDFDFDMFSSWFRGCCVHLEIAFAKAAAASAAERSASAAGSADAGNVAVSPVVARNRERTIGRRANRGDRDEKTRLARQRRMEALQSSDPNQVAAVEPQSTQVRQEARAHRDRMRVQVAQQREKMDADRKKMQTYTLAHEQEKRDNHLKRTQESSAEIDETLQSLRAELEASRKRRVDAAATAAAAAKAAPAPKVLREPLAMKMQETLDSVLPTVLSALTTVSAEQLDQTGSTDVFKFMGDVQPILETLMLPAAVAGGDALGDLVARLRGESAGSNYDAPLRGSLGKIADAIVAINPAAAVVKLQHVVAPPAPVTVATPAAAPVAAPVPAPEATPVAATPVAAAPVPEPEPEPEPELVKTPESAPAEQAEHNAEANAGQLKALPKRPKPGARKPPSRPQRPKPPKKN